MLYSRSSISFLILLASTFVQAQNGPLNNKALVCENILDTCPFGSTPGCVANFCQGTPYNWGSCEEVISGAPASCCHNSNPQACFAALQADEPPPSQATITVPPASGVSGGNGAVETNPCSVLASIQLECISSSSNRFLNAPVSIQAQCLCYGLSGNYRPDQWDLPASACLAQGPAQDPLVYSELLDDANDGLAFCTDFAGPNPIPSLTGIGAGAGAAPTSNNAFPRATAQSAGIRQSIPMTTLVCMILNIGVLIWL